jgi:protein-disulfide isomerase
MKKEVKILLASVVVIVVCVLALVWKNQKQTDVVTSNLPENLTREFNHKMGPDNAKVKIVEFYDPECEACSAFFPYVKDVMKEYEGKIQLIVRYALYHGNSTQAAKAIEAAGKQGKYWEYQELMFLNQGQWTHRNSTPWDLFERYAADLELNMEQFKMDINEQSFVSNFAIDIADGKNLGVQGTPTIFINGVKMETLHPAAFREKIQEAMK